MIKNLKKTVTHPCIFWKFSSGHINGNDNERGWSAAGGFPADRQPDRRLAAGERGRSGLGERLAAGLAEPPDDDQGRPGDLAEARPHLSGQHVREPVVDAVVAESVVAGPKKIAPHRDDREDDRLGRSDEQWLSSSNNGAQDEEDASDQGQIRRERLGAVFPPRRREHDGLSDVEETTGDRSVSPFSPTAQTRPGRRRRGPDRAAAGDQYRERARRPELTELRDDRRRARRPDEHHRPQ